MQALATTGPECRTESRQAGTPAARPLRERHRALVVGHPGVVDVGPARAR